MKGSLIHKTVFHNHGFKAYRNLCQIIQSILEKDQSHQIIQERVHALQPFFREQKNYRIIQYQ